MKFKGQFFAWAVIWLGSCGPAIAGEPPPTGFLQLTGGTGQNNVAHQKSVVDPPKTKPATLVDVKSPQERVQDFVEGQKKLRKLTQQTEQKPPGKSGFDHGSKPKTVPDAGCAAGSSEGCAAKSGAGCAADKVTHQVPVVAQRLQSNECGSEPNSTPVNINFLADYNNGFLIRPIDENKDPFRLRVNAWIQFRRVEFNRDRDFWTDNAGVTRPIRNRNAFDVERSRLVFSGFAFDKRLTYFLHLDGDTDGGEGVDFFDYWWAWKHSDALRFQFGKRKVPGSRQWLLGARNTRFADRPIATDFFRPDRTTGVFATGKLDESVFYQVMVGNGYRTANQNSSQINGKFAVSGTGYWEPTGAFGNDLTDHDLHNEAVYRIGHSLTWSQQNGFSPGGTPLRETDFIRLSDGTRLLQTGALAPGVTVSEFDVTLYAVDAAMKYQGISFNSEFYFQWLDNLAGNGALPISSLYRRGFFVEGGTVIVPDKLDWNLRYSEVNGPYGKASEYGVGLNIYPIDTRKVKISVDLTKFDQSPLNNTATEVLAGESGTLLRTQFQAEF